MAGIKAIGSKLYVNNGTSSSPDWERIAHLTSIGEVGVESDEIETTDLDTTGDFKEFIGGAKDGGTIGLQGNIVDDEGLADLYALASTREQKQFKVEYPLKTGETTPTSWTVTGFVVNCKDGEKTTDGLLTFTAGIRVSGEPLLTPGSTTPVSE